MKLFTYTLESGFLQKSIIDNGITIVADFKGEPLEEYYTDSAVFSLNISDIYTKL